MKYILIACVVFLGGCNSGSTSTGQGEVILKTASMLGGSDAAATYYSDLLKEFDEDNHNITIQDKSDNSTEEWKKSTVESFYQEKESPDVIFYFTGADARQLILDNMFVSLEEIRTEYPEYGKNIRSSTMDLMREFDGNHYAVPVRGFWEGLFCNKDLFDQYNLELPYNWENLMTAIEVFSKNNVTPISVSFNEVPHYWIEHTILAQGGSIEHKLNPYQYVPDSWVKAMGLIKQLGKLNAFSDQESTPQNNDAIELFIRKKAAMMLEGSWTMSAIEDRNTTIVLPFPSAPNGKKDSSDIIAGYSTGFYISRKAWDDPIKRDAAMKLAMKMTSNESIAYLCKASGAPAADITIDGSESLLEQSATTLQQAAKHANMPIDSKLYKEAWQYLCKEISKLAVGQVEPLDVITQVSLINKW